MPKLDISFKDNTGIDKLVKKMPKAIVDSLNRSAEAAATVACKQITEVYTISFDEIRKRVAIRDASMGRYNAIIIVTSRLVSLAKFSPQQTKPGVTIQIKRGGARKLLTGTFLAKVRAGRTYHVGVFHRKGKARLPIAERLTISVSQMFAAKSVQTKVLAFLEDRRRKELARLLNENDHG